jgi:hypothetical protein
MFHQLIGWWPVPNALCLYDEVNTARRGSSSTPLASLKAELDRLQGPPSTVLLRNHLMRRSGDGLSARFLPARSLFELFFAHGDDDGIPIGIRPHLHLVPGNRY